MEVEIKNVKKSYRKNKVLKEISLMIKAGECTGIIGANGCGKSTLLKVLAGIEKADGGEILINNQPVKWQSSQLAGYVGYVPQESVLIPELTVEDNLKLWASFGEHKKNEEILRRLGEQFQLEDFYRKKVKYLSGGMNKRVNIVCALIHQPFLLLMDEPSTSLDLVFKEELREYIRSFTAKGGSVLLSSHDEGEIAGCASLWAIKNGIAQKVPQGETIEKIVSEYMK